MGAWFLDSELSTCFLLCLCFSFDRLFVQGAFCKYLSCVRHIAELLSEDAAAHRSQYVLSKALHSL